MESCPNCGADLPRNARACPECGSDDETGWSDKASENQLGLPDEDFDYDRFVAEEFGEGKKPRRWLSWLWWATALVILSFFAWSIFRGFR